MTKSALSLIIIMVPLLNGVPGRGPTNRRQEAKKGKAAMRVMLYPDGEGKFAVLLLPSPGKGVAPVLLQAVDPGEVRERVGPEVDKMRGVEPRGP